MRIVFMRTINKTQDVMPCNIINLSDITRHWEWPPLKSCPFLEDFVTYNGLWPARPTWFAPPSEDFVTYNGLQPAGPTWFFSSSEDFVTYNRLWPTRPTWFAPRWRTLSRTPDFNPLGQHDLPLIGGLCLVQQTSTRWVSMITQQDIASNKQTNDTSRVTLRTTQNEYPKTNYYW